VTEALGSAPAGPACCGEAVLFEAGAGGPAFAGTNAVEAVSATLDRPRSRWYVAGRRNATPELAPASGSAHPTYDARGVA
jgi:hypothetical protein